jgi:hypothetical protein
MTPLEGNIINELVRQYKRNGYNVQRILDNPAFNALPFPSKLEALQQHADSLGGSPSFDAKEVAVKALKAGATTGAIIGMGHAFKYGAILPKPLAIATGIGAGLGAAYKIADQYHKYKIDRTTAGYIREGKGMEALIDRSMLNSPSHVPNTNAILGKINEINSRMHGEGIQLSSAGEPVTMIDVIKDLIKGHE